MQPIITENREKIAELCRTHHVRRLSVFGSAVRDDFNPECSDVDLLVEFALDDHLRYAPNFFSLQRSLTTLFGREVDLIVEGAVRNPFILHNVEAQKELLYAA